VTSAGTSNSFAVNHTNDSGVHIEAYPSHHLDAMRGLSSVCFILLDEADFFPPGQQQDARDVLEVHCKIKPLDNNGINS
jgi:hypothetical protein